MGHGLRLDLIAGIDRAVWGIIQKMKLGLSGFPSVSM